MQTCLLDRPSVSSIQSSKLEKLSTTLQGPHFEVLFHVFSLTIKIFDMITSSYAYDNLFSFVWESCPAKVHHTKLRRISTCREKFSFRGKLTFELEMDRNGNTKKWKN